MKSIGETLADLSFALTVPVADRATIQIRKDDWHRLADRFAPFTKVDPAKPLPPSYAGIPVVVNPILPRNVGALVTRDAAGAEHWTFFKLEEPQS